jgi:hypothetical protein
MFINIHYSSLIPFLILIYRYDTLIDVKQACGTAVDILKDLPLPLNPYLLIPTSLTPNPLPLYG